MKIILIILSCYLSIAWAMASDSFSIISQMENQLAPASYVMRLNIIYQTPNKPDVTYESLLLAKNHNQKMFFRMLQSTNRKARDILILPKGIWFYLPEIERVLQLSNSSNWGGTNLDYGDFFRVRLLESYKIHNIETHPDHYEVTFYALNDTASYAAMQYFISNPTCELQKILFFSSSGKLLKTLEMNSNKIQVTSDYDETTTTIQILWRKEVSLDDQIFTRENFQQKWDSIFWP